MRQWRQWQSLMWLCRYSKMIQRDQQQHSPTDGPARPAEGPAPRQPGVGRGRVSLSCGLARQTAKMTLLLHPFTSLQHSPPLMWSPMPARSAQATQCSRIEVRAGTGSSRWWTLPGRVSLHGGDGGLLFRPSDLSPCALLEGSRAPWLKARRLSQTHLGAGQPWMGRMPVQQVQPRRRRSCCPRHAALGRRPPGSASRCVSSSYAATRSPSSRGRETPCHRRGPTTHGNSERRSRPPVQARPGRRAPQSNVK